MLGELRASACGKGYRERSDMTGRMRRECQGDDGVSGLFIALGLMLFSGGIGAIVYGWPYLVLEYGFTIVIAGAVAANCGLVLLGIGLVLRGVRRVSEKLSHQIADASPRAAKETAPPPDATAAETMAAGANDGKVAEPEAPVESGADNAMSPENLPVSTEASESEANAPAETPAPLPAGTDEGIVRTYTVGDTSFTMYANGTVKAQTPEGIETFANVDELRRYLATRMNTAV
jgi:hypothetical protein